MANPKLPTPPWEDEPTVATKKPSTQSQGRTPNEISITVTRTAQPRQYESVTVSLTERHTLEPDEDPVKTRNQIYKQISERVARYSDRELKRYQSEDDDA